MAIALSIAIFLFLYLLGNAILTPYKKNYDNLTIFFLSPAIGLGTFVSIIFILNKLNFSLAEVVRPLFLLIFIFLVVSFYYKNYSIQLRQVWLYLALGLISLCLVGYPLFIYGLNWISVGNDDMANYVLGAQRFIENGYFAIPDSAALKEGRNYSQALWTLHAPLGVRSGAELFLGALWAVTGINAIKLFMPTILAFQIAQIFAAMSILSNATNDKKILKLAFLLLAFSPLIALGSILQLIGQVGGLALLCATITIFLQVNDHVDINLRTTRFYINLFPKIIASFSLFIWYPETLPIFILALILFLIIKKFIYKVSIKNYLIELLIVIFLVSLISGSSLYSGTQYILYQIFYGSSLQSADPTWSALLFPYYLLPSGIGVIWGLLPISGIAPEPQNTILIIVGIILFLWVLFFTIKNSAPQFLNLSSILVAQVILGITLINGGNGFGLFKLAMFISPFLLCALSISFRTIVLRGFNKIFYLLVPLYIIGNISVIQTYGTLGGLIKDNDKNINSFNLSEIKVAESFENFVNQISGTLNKDAILLSQTSNMFLAKIEAFHAKNLRIYFPSADFFLDRYAALGLNNIDIKVLDESQQYKNYEIGGNKFKLLDSNLLKSKEVYLIYDTNRFDVFNNYYTKPTREIFVLDKNPKNRLLFINSSEGVNYYSLFRKKSAFYQLEKDSYFPNANFASFNKNILAEAINPTEKSRLLLELTNTPTQQFGNKLPSPKVNNQILNLAGSGSARVYSDPVIFNELDGHKLLLLDMQREGKPFPQNKSFLMKAYGKDVLMDSRYITTFVRDLSLIPNEDYLTLNRPSQISIFPTDLINKNLEYSGIYENGDLSNHSFAILNSNSDTNFLKIKGKFATSELSYNAYFNCYVYLDQKLVKNYEIKTPDFDLSISTKISAGSHKVEIRFEKVLIHSQNEFKGPHLEFMGFTSK